MKITVLGSGAWGTALALVLLENGNDVTLWSRVNLTVSTFLDNMWRMGMLAGGSPAESYFVEIGNTTMTKDDIMNGRLICNIGIAPSRPAEFVIFRVSQMTAEAGGGEAAE